MPVALLLERLQSQGIGRGTNSALQSSEPAQYTCLRHATNCKDRKDSSATNYLLQLLTVGHQDGESLPPATQAGVQCV